MAAVLLEDHRVKAVTKVRARHSATAVPARPSWEALFDLVEDEREQKNLLKSGARAEQAEALREILVQMVTSLTAVGKTAEKTIQPDPELREQLRALGYVE